MPPTTHQTVTVNLNVSVDASGNIDVFGQTAPNIINKIVATTKLPVRALYDASGASNSGILNSFFEFWEPSNNLLDPSDNLGTRRARLAVSEDRNYLKMASKLVMDLQSVIMGEFDCSDAKPFDEYKTSSEEYYKHPHFGRVALSSYAYYLFGHVAATAAITNDTAFMEAMMSTTGVSATSPGIYKYTSTAQVDISDNMTTTDANLSARLVDKIINMTDADVLKIVEQVLGQDASRAMGEDNNELAPGGTHPLKFIAGDKIYLNIQLKRPNVTISNGGSNAGAPDASQKFLDNADTNYTLEITLDDIPGTIIVPSGLSTIDVSTINEIYNSISTLNIQNNDTVNISSSVYDLNTITDTSERYIVRDEILDNIFINNNISSFTTTTTDLGIVTPDISGNITVINSANITEPVSISNIDSNTNIYAHIPSTGTTITFTDGNTTYTITKTGINTYMYDGVEYYTGNVITLGDKKLTFGSIIISSSSPTIPKTEDSFWRSVGHDLDDVKGNVNSIEIKDNNVYIGGSFRSIRNSANTGCFAIWTGENWITLDNSNRIESDWGVYEPPYISYLALKDDYIYMAGKFASFGYRGMFNRYIFNIGRWNTVTNTISNIAGIGTELGDSEMSAIAFDSSDNIYFGGRYKFLPYYESSTGRGALRHNIARFNDGTWTSLNVLRTVNGKTEVIPGIDHAHIRAIVSKNNILYIGGTFTASSSYLPNNASYIVKWENNTWSALGLGLNGAVYTLTLSDDGNILYVGGEFTSAGGVGNTKGIAMWNVQTQQWSSVGGGVNGMVYSVTSFDNNIFIGGRFTSPSNNIAKWNGSALLGLGSGVNSEVKAVKGAIQNGEKRIYVGGAFTKAGNINARQLAYFILEDTELWQQRGATLVGQEGNRAGWSTSLSSDGLTLAYGSPYAYSSAGGQSGLVDVRTWNGTSWQPKGQAIQGESYADEAGFFNNEQTGASISLDASGNTIAIGAPGSGTIEGGGLRGNTRIFLFDDSTNTWVQKGDTIWGERWYNASGYKIVLSSDGNTVAISAPEYDGDVPSAFNDIGNTRVFTWNSLNNTWEQKGNSIIGINTGDFTGLSIDLSSDGNIVAIGSPFYSNNDNIFNGNVIVYEWNNSTNIWEQKGSQINGENTEDLVGYSVSLDSSGTTLAFGVQYANTINGTTSGKVLIYNWNSSTNDWIIKGSEIVGMTSNEEIGVVLELNSDGNTIVIGAPYKDNNIGNNIGCVRIYDYVNGSWVQRGFDIIGQAEGDIFGSSVSINSNGNIVSIGAPSNDDNGNNAGNVRVYEWN
jgi:hypothetical protein